jgi:hypothetical protein
VFWTTTFWVSTEWFIARKTFQEALQILWKDFYPIWVTWPNLFLLHLEELINWLHKVINRDFSSHDREEIVAQGHVISGFRTIPFFDWLLSVSIDSGCFVVASEVDVVVMGYCSVAVALAHVRARTTPLVGLLPFRKDIDSEYLILFIRIPIFTRYTFRPKFLFDLRKHTWKLILLVPLLHLSHRQGFRLFSFILPLFVSFRDVALNKFSNICICKLIGQQLHDFLCQ